MKSLRDVGTGLALLLVTGRSLAQDGTMMNGGMWGSGWMGAYGGYWAPLLVLVIAVGLVVWVVNTQRK